MDRLKNKVAVITGGNSGIGFATAEEFIAEGAEVVITGRNTQSVNEAVAKLGAKAVGITADVQNMADLKQLAQRVQQHHAKIDILFINAGISMAAPIDQVDEQHFDSLFDINVKGAFFSIQQLLPLFNEKGSIILNASAVVHRGFTGLSVYTATKGALSAMARSLSTELVDRKIRINTISPGPIETPIHGKMGMSADMKDGYTQMVPMKRFGTPREIATIATFLASDDSSFVIGEEIVAGGGVGTL
jgi:NAD(P)-dependent dehydrogenase (short-subunit alcohol dehydrogenase family)